MYIKLLVFLKERYGKGFYSMWQSHQAIKQWLEILNKQTNIRTFNLNLHTEKITCRENWKIQARPYISVSIWVRRLIFREWQPESKFALSYWGISYKCWKCDNSVYTALKWYITCTNILESCQPVAWSPDLYFHRTVS